MGTAFVSGAEASEVCEAANATTPDATPRIYRDPKGVATVQGENSLQVAFGAGYVNALDRPFQLTSARLLSQGRLSELLGVGSLESDVLMRRDFFDRAEMIRQVNALPPAVLNELQAYSEGINRGLCEVSSAPDKKPVAWLLSGFEPEAWSPIDSMAISSLLSNVGNGGAGAYQQLENSAFLSKLVKMRGRKSALRMFFDFRFQNDPSAPSIVRKGEGAPPYRPLTTERLGNAQFRSSLALGSAANALASEMKRDFRGLQSTALAIGVPKEGSYAAAVAGSRTKSGGPVIIGSPQAGLSAPASLYELGTSSPGSRCFGATVPGGGPWTVIGGCNGTAMSVVAGDAGNQVDTYIETLNPKNPRQYWFKGKWRNMVERIETYDVGACGPPLCEETTSASTEVRSVFSTVHGSVTEFFPERGIAVSKKRTQNTRLAGNLRAYSSAARATDLRSLNRSLNSLSATFNLVMADRKKIGYRLSGKQPIRARGINRQLPSPGNGAFEWRGFVPQKRMPRITDPKGGILAVNQGNESKPAYWWPSSDSINIGKVSRILGNRRTIAAAGRIDLNRMKWINPRLLEKVDGITPALYPALSRALRSVRDPQLKMASKMLDKWARGGFRREDKNGDGAYDAPAIALFSADSFNLTRGAAPEGDESKYERYLWKGLLRDVFSDEIGSEAPPGLYVSTQLSVLEQALRPSGKSRLSRNYLSRNGKHRTAAQFIRKNVKNAMTQLESAYGTRDMSSWLLPVPKIEFAAQGVVSPPSISGYDHGTYSFIADLGASRIAQILPPGNIAADSLGDYLAGQNGVLPANFNDQSQRYERYGFFEVPWKSTFRQGAESEIP